MAFPSARIVLQMDDCEHHHPQSADSGISKTSYANDKEDQQIGKVLGPNFKCPSENEAWKIEGPGSSDFGKNKSSDEEAAKNKETVNSHPADLRDPGNCPPEKARPEGV